MKRKLIKMTQPVDESIILNELDEISLDLLVNSYESETYGEVPTCLNGCLTGAFYENTLCKKCNTKVVKDRRAFIIKPRFKDFINVEFLYQLNAITSDIVNLFTPGAKLKDAALKKWTKVDVHFQQNYEYFVENLDRFMNFISNYRRFYNIVELYEESKDVLFTEYMMVIGKNLFQILVTYQVKVGEFNPIRNMIDLATSDEYYEIYNAIFSLKTFYNKKVLQSRKGTIRDQELGAYMPFNMRAVGAGSNIAVDEIEIPWLGAIEMFRPIIVSELLKKGYKYRVVKEKLNDAQFIADKDIIEILQVISKQRRASISVRNPTLTKSSDLLLKMIIKTDPKDFTLGISNLATEPFRGDFDGDEYSVTLTIDKFIEDGLQGLVPNETVIELYTPEISRTITKSSIGVLLKREQTDSKESFNNIF